MTRRYALYLIQQGLDERILIRIAEATTAIQAWDKLRIEYQGNTKILSVKLYSLLQEHQIMKMKNGEKVQDFISLVVDIVYKICMLRETVPEHTIVGKILRSHVVSSIVESKDLGKFTVKKLGGSLKGY